MTIESKIIAGLQAVSTAVRALRTVVTGSATGTLTTLLTAAKTSILDAINELKAKESIGFRYTYSLTSQPRSTWVQPTVLTLATNGAASQVTQASGSFTFAAASVPNVAGHWIFVMEAEPQISGVVVSAAVEMRVNGASVGRQAFGGVSTGLGVPTRAHAMFGYKILGTEVITFHFIIDFAPLLLGATTSDVKGMIAGMKL